MGAPILSAWDQPEPCIVQMREAYKQDWAFEFFEIVTKKLASTSDTK